ncbi:DUF1508 domain-containing protein [Flavobacterium pectinovorum]|jgi:uncharacterized protein YegP (UPF0339 family)|uniref:DUF1508 domain-containing protein n=1 Tax=Flavobacterium pectinovorum TaxID=29533 RepID=A0AB36P2W1_9FLAO|nr:DUF1508 domain-containing protein [Flavobacterium pectinovorum]OXB06089.1 DUF1508 domain-containing protein [Flavobacterium pectinovorum]WKL47407.1 DUF1508 domain-containing protein [Flavobacterium pectinovorum]SHM94607.1 hypothetical protein SAMN05444387_3534 [Flavobacterium pectinovorum]
MGAFVISRRFNDEYKFVFTSRKGKVIFTSLSYELKFECEEDIEKFKLNVDQARFLKFKGSGGKYFFKLMLGEVHFATSRKYTTELLLQKGIKEIVTYSSKSEILDFSSNESIFEDEEVVEEEEVE